MPRPSVQGSDGEAPTRLERDPLGPIAVPQAALYGAQTERGRGNFRVSGLTLADRPELIAALGQVKAASVRANQGLGEVPGDLARVILQAAREVAANELDEHFPLDVVQGGGGTATNMNANEVIANRAADLLGRPRGVYDVVNPNNHVNRSQLTNDVYPTALQLAVVVRSGQAVEGVRYLADTIRSAGEKVGGLLRIGRTCLRDALPVEIQATGNGEASALERCARDLETASSELLAVPLGATAVGTGFGAPEGYKELAVRYLAEESGLAVTPVEDPYDALSHLDKFIAVASHLVRSALTMAKIAADLRILSSGPLGGIDEVGLPARPGWFVDHARQDEPGDARARDASVLRGQGGSCDRRGGGRQRRARAQRDGACCGTAPARRLGRCRSCGAPLRRSMRLRARMAAGRSRRASLQLIRRSRRTCTTRRLRSRIRVLA